MAFAVPSGLYGQPHQPKPESQWKMRHPNAQEREWLWPSDLQPKVTELKDIATQRVFQWESDTTWFRAYEVELHLCTGTKNYHKNKKIYANSHYAYSQYII